MFKSSYLLYLYCILRSYTRSGLFLTNFIFLWFPTLIIILVKLVIFFVLVKTVCKACYNLYINAQICYFVVILYIFRASSVQSDDPSKDDDGNNRDNQSLRPKRNQEYGKNSSEAKSDKDSGKSKSTQTGSGKHRNKKLNTLGG